MEYAIMLDFGSTYTKVVCAHLPSRRVVVTAKHPSTVHSDARICMTQCMNTVTAEIGLYNTEKALKISCSSAAGGLKIAVVGLTFTLSSLAGKHAAYGAGAKVVAEYSGYLQQEHIVNLERASQELVLLCGGYENGNHSIVLHNARVLASSKIAVPVIYAGNSAVAQQVYQLFRSHGKECFLAENIIPHVNVTNSLPVKALIRDLFIQRIVNMKGLSHVQSLLDAPLMPTPSAVLSAGELLAFGTGEQIGLGPLLMVDVGGATTDVYSFSENTSYQGAKIIGTIEPTSKRTVEGDIGMRESSGHLIEEGMQQLANESGATEADLLEAIRLRTGQVSWIPNDDRQRRIDLALARQAVAIAVRRHAGRIEPSCSGGQILQYGKNLTDIHRIIGIGGIIANVDKPFAILEKALRCDERDGLVPENASFDVDKDYVFYAAGLLRPFDKNTAFEIMLQSIQ